MLLVKRYLGWVAMSPNGPKRTRRSITAAAAFGGKADTVAVSGRGS